MSLGLVEGVSGVSRGVFNWCDKDTVDKVITLFCSKGPMGVLDHCLVLLKDV